jgi:acetate kinase
MPSDLALASSWDEALAERPGEAVGAEARAKGFTVLLSGAVNLIRDPRSGRSLLRRPQRLRAWRSSQASSIGGLSARVALDPQWKHILRKELFVTPGNMLLAFNPGSSSIKFAIYEARPPHAQRIGRGVIDLRRQPLTLHVAEGPQKADIVLKAPLEEDFHGVIDETLGWLAEHFSFSALAAIGHRVVHGGDRFAGPALIDDETLDAIVALTPLAPLHQSQSVRLIQAIRRLRPQTVQIASFDTAFHRSQSDLIRRFALPRALFDEGVKRYGFHGLSYKYIAARLASLAPDLAKGRVVVAHLGSGVSLCALQDGVSRDTSMGFSTLDGAPMATRCGALDPGVLIHLVKERKMSIEAVEDMLYHKSGLLGVSGISADSRALLASKAPEASEALALFAFRVSREAVALASTIGGLDAFVFTAGLGEHQPETRAAIAARLAWLNVKIDERANAANAQRIDAPDSRVALLVIPTDEEQTIADETMSLLLHSPGGRAAEGEGNGSSI